MKRTIEELYDSCIDFMVENNFTDDDIKYFQREGDFESSIMPETLHKWLERQECYYRTHYRIGNNIFTICKKSENMHGIHYGYHDIFEAYDKPSIYKVRIWETWLEELRPYCNTIYISSRNGFMFTIGGELVLPTTGEVVPFYITKTRQEIYI